MRPQSLHTSLRLTASAGLSLLELGLVMAIVALALVPMVKSIGGPMSASGKGSAAQMTGFKNKEGILATNLANQVLAGDYSSFQCQPAGTYARLPLSPTLKAYQKCTSSTDKLDYQWSVMPNNEINSNGTKKIPDGYSYYKGVLNIFEQGASPSASPLLSMPVNFFEYNKFDPPKKEQTGVIIALDRSSSMLWSKNADVSFPPQIAPSIQVFDPNAPVGFGMPFLWYRYKPFPGPGQAEGWQFDFPVISSGPGREVTQPLDPWNNATLDIVSAQNMAGLNGKDPEPDTPYNESYLGSNRAFNCAVDPNNLSHWSRTSELAYIFNHNWLLSDNSASTTARQHVVALCREKNNKNQWENALNQNLSRLEAARTAALSLLLKLEERPSVVEAIKLGYFPWGSYPALTQFGTPMVLAEPSPRDSKQKVFKAVREKLLWFNRMDPEKRRSDKAVPQEGGTNIAAALKEAADQLRADKTIKRRIIVLMTDGQPFPNVAENSTDGLLNFAENNLGCGNLNAKNRITLFSVGLLQADEKLMGAMSNATPNGQFFPAYSISDLKPIFDNIAYEIQKLALLSTADRYGLDLSNDDNACGR